jgi:hypothetical protein
MAQVNPLFQLVKQAVRSATVGSGPWYTLIDQGTSQEPARPAPVGGAPEAAFIIVVTQAKIEPTRNSEEHCAQQNPQAQCTERIERTCRGAEATFSMQVDLVELATSTRSCGQTFTGKASAPEQCDDRDVTDESFLGRLVRGVLDEAKEEDRSPQWQVARYTAREPRARVRPGSRQRARHEQIVGRHPPVWP